MRHHVFFTVSLPKDMTLSTSRFLYSVTAKGYDSVNITFSLQCHCQRIWLSASRFLYSVTAKGYDSVSITFSLQCHCQRIWLCQHHVFFTVSLPKDMILSTSRFLYSVTAKGYDSVSITPRPCRFWLVGCLLMCCLFSSCLLLIHRCTHWKAQRWRLDSELKQGVGDSWTQLKDATLRW